VTAAELIKLATNTADNVATLTDTYQRRAIIKSAVNKIGREQKNYFTEHICDRLVHLLDLERGITPTETTTRYRDRAISGTGTAKPAAPVS
jgi:hypothetical protein